MLIFAPNLVPVGSAGGAIACPHRVPRARLPTVQRGRRAGGAACRSLVCAVATPPSTERGPRGRPPATLLPPQSFTWICFPPQNLLALDLDVVQGLPALQPQHRPQTGSFKPCVPGSVPAPSATEQASAPGSAGGRDTRLRAAGAGAQARRGLGPPCAPLGPWLLRSGFAPQ